MIDFSLNEPLPFPISQSNYDSFFLHEDNWNKRDVINF